MLPAIWLRNLDLILRNRIKEIKVKVVSSFDDKDLNYISSCVEKYRRQIDSRNISEIDSIRIRGQMNVRNMQ